MVLGHPRNVHTSCASRLFAGQMDSRDAAAVNASLPPDAPIRVVRTEHAGLRCVTRKIRRETVLSSGRWC